MPCAGTKLQNGLFRRESCVFDEICKKRRSVPGAVPVKLLGDGVKHLSQFHDLLLSLAEIRRKAYTVIITAAGRSP